MTLVVNKVFRTSLLSKKIKDSLTFKLQLALFQKRSQSNELRKQCQWFPSTWVRQQGCCSKLNTLCARFHRVKRRSAGAISVLTPYQVLACHRFLVLCS